MELDNFWPTTQAPLPPISDSELEYLFMIDKEEMMWKQSQPKYSFRELITIFPEAILPARRGLKQQHRNLKEKMRDINLNQEEYYEKRICKIPWQERNEFQEESNKDFDQARAKISSKIKTIMFNLSYLDELEGKGTPKIMGGVNEADIARAKEVPIMNFLSGNMIAHGGRVCTKCPFHNETNASFYVYLDQNSWWCYSCSAGGSIIDFIMRQQNVDFLTAVKFLLK